MPPPPTTPEQIILYGKRQSRLIHLEANVIGYFSHIFQSSLPSGRAPTTRTVTAIRVPGALSL
jgi:hypothetical protein